MVSTLEESVELNTSALTFLEIFSTKVYELTSISPDIVQSLEIVSGSWGSIGLTILVNYTIDGEAQVAKMELTSLDLVGLSLTFKILEGDLVEVYNSFSVTLKLTPNILSGSVVYWTFEYEKPSSDTSDPTSLMEAAVQVSKDIDAYVGHFI